MAALGFARSTLCSSCIHRIAGDDISHLWFPFYRQLRGKKKSAKRPTTINVKLLEDIIGFGRKGNAHHHCNRQHLCWLILMAVIGSICPVEPGRMRNSWYPRQKAAYMTESTSQGLKPQSIVAERDFTFGMKPKEEEQSPEQNAPKKERAVEVQTKLLSVCVFLRLLEVLRRLTATSA